MLTALSPVTASSASPHPPPRPQPPPTALTPPQPMPPAPLGNFRTFPAGHSISTLACLQPFAHAVSRENFKKYKLGLFIPLRKIFQRIPFALRMKFRICLVWPVPVSPASAGASSPLSPALRRAGLSLHQQHQALSGLRVFDTLFLGASSSPTPHPSTLINYHPYV